MFQTVALYRQGGIAILAARFGFEKGNNFYTFKTRTVMHAIYWKEAGSKGVKAGI